MSKEVRAVVFGLVVVVLAAIALSFWHGPAREFHRIRSFRVEVKKKDGDEIRRMSFNVPVTLLAQLTRIAHIDESFDRDIRRAWDNSDITPREILDAADESEKDKPSILHKDEATIAVLADGDTIRIDVTKERDPDENVHIALPRHLLEVFADRPGPDPAPRRAQPGRPRHDPPRGRRGHHHGRAEEGRADLVEALAA
jgi:hypothetical protein